MVTMHYMATMYHVVTAHHSLQMYHVATMYHVTAVYKHICNVSHGFVELLLLSGIQLTLKQHRLELQSPLRPKFFSRNTAKYCKCIFAYDFLIHIFLSLAYIVVRT